MPETFQELVSKVFSVLVDRRFWFTVVLPFLVIHTTLPEEELKPYVEAIYLLVATAIQNLSWATRPPSGLGLEKALRKLRELDLL